MALPQILQQLGTNSQQIPDLEPIRKTIQTLRSAKDPQALMQQMMMQRNPNMQKAMQYVREHGNDPKAAFENLAREKGFDPDEIMKNLL
jgi:hypothetical protein